MKVASTTLALSLLVAGLARAEPSAPAAEPPPSATAPSAPASSVTPPGQSDRGRAGVALLAGGAALMASTATGVTLLTALTTPDDNRNKQQHPEIVQASGFVTVALGSLSAGLMLVGGALLLNDATPPAPASATTSSETASMSP